MKDPFAAQRGEDQLGDIAGPNDMSMSQGSPTHDRRMSREWGT